MLPDWIPLHGWSIPLRKYPLLAVGFLPPVPAAVKAQVVKGLPAVWMFHPGQLQKARIVQWFPAV